METKMFFLQHCQDYILLLAPLPHGHYARAFPLPMQKAEALQRKFCTPRARVN
jgi:hypothetical protein